MEPNQNPPCEREWTIQEREEFFASIGLSGTPINKEPFRPIEWSTSTWNGPIHPLSSDDPFGDLERFIHPGVNITSIVPPEQGWPIVAHCDLCKKTVIVLSPYAVKPEKGDYFLLKGTCLDEELNVKHNLYPQFDFPNPSRMGPRPEEWTAEAYQYYWNSSGVPSMFEFTQEMPIDEAKKRWPNTPITGEE